MNDLIQSLSKTPLPTILVVAGILFLFLSIGGRLGAQIVTDTIKRKFAGALGAVLLIVGISIYFAGQIIRQIPPTSPSQGPTEEVTYLLRASSVPVGQVVMSKSQYSVTDGQLTLQHGQDHIVQKVSIEGSDAEKTEILSSSNGRPTILKKTILSDVVKTTIHDGARATTETKKGVLSGHSILIERKGSGWVKSLLEATPTKLQQAELNTPYADEYETFPAEPVSIGATWTLNGPQLAYLSGLGNLLSIDGSAFLMLERIEDCGENKCAIISVKRLELTGSMLEEGNVVQVKLGGSGLIHLSLSEFINTKYSFTGTLMYESDVVVEENNVKWSLAGPITVSGTESKVRD